MKFTNNISLATSEDIPTIKNIMDEVYDNLSTKSWFYDRDMQFLCEHIDLHGATLKYMLDHKMVGYLIMRHPIFSSDNLGYYLDHLNPGDLSKIVQIESMAVLPKKRGLGISDKMLGVVDNLASNNNVRYLMASIHPDDVYSYDNLTNHDYTAYRTMMDDLGLPRTIMYKKIL